MALGTFRPGEYTATYDGNTLGMCRSSGKVFSAKRKAQPIDDTDTYGKTVIDGVYQGAACFLKVTFLEWVTGMKAAIWPQSTTFNGRLGVIGRLESDLAKALVLTVVAATTAATNGPASVTFSKAILAEENDMDVIFAPDEHPCPVVFKLFPYDTGAGVIGFFTQT